MTNAELIYEEVKTLPENRKAQVLEFVKHIKQEESQIAENDNAPGGDDSWFEKGEPCPVCAKHRDPETGNPLYKPEILAGMQEVEDMISGKKPVKWHTSLDDLDEILGL